MSTENKPRELLDELATLQQVLDDAAGEQIDFNSVLTKLNTVDEVPVLSDLFNSDEAPVLRPVKQGDRKSHLSAVQTPPPSQPRPVITRDILEYLREEMQRKGNDDNSLETLHDILHGAAERQQRSEEHPNNQKVQNVVDHNNSDDPDVPTLTEEETYSELDAMLDDAALDDDIPMADEQVDIAFSLAELASQATDEHEILRDIVEDDEPELLLDEVSDTLPGSTANSAAAASTDSKADKDTVQSSRADDIEPTLDEVLDSALGVQPESPKTPDSLRAALSPKPTIDELAALAKAVAQETEAKATTRNPNNPFLPKSVLDRLTVERQAAQQSAEEAHRTMQRVMQGKMENDSKAVASLSKSEQEQIVDTLIDELTPLIQARLREKLRAFMNQKPNKTPE